MNEFEIDKRQVRRAFSRAAHDYDASAVLQREVCQRMLEKLDYIKLQPSRVLDVGSGTGWGTRQLGERYPKAEITALDIALGMLQVARGTSSWWNKLFSAKRENFLCADVEALPIASNSVEMVWSNLALQWCNDLPATFVELQRVIKVDGLLMFSSFGVDTLQELRTAFHDCGWLQPPQSLRRYARHWRHAGGGGIHRSGDGDGKDHADLQRRARGDARPQEHRCAQRHCRASDGFDGKSRMAAHHREL